MGENPEITSKDYLSLLNYALDTWNAKLSEIWALLTQEPDTFKGGGIWNVMLDINCSGLAEMKRPELAFKLLLRFALAKAAVGYGLDLMLALFSIIQGMVSTVITQSGLSGVTGTALPQDIVDRINRVDFLNSIPLWIVTLLGGLFIIVLAFIMILTVYARMFKIYIFSAISPIPLSSFAGEPTSNIGKNFLRAYAGVCLEGVIIALACVIFTVMASTPPLVNPGVADVTAVWSYIMEVIFNLLVLVGAVRMSDRIVKELLGL